MNQFLSGAQQGRAPYHLLVTLNVCTCTAAPQNMGTARSVDKLLPSAIGYWELYTAFWGHLPRMLAVSIVDVRDGSVMWRNGRHLLQEDDHGNKEQHPDPLSRPRGGGNHRGTVPRGRGNRVRWSGA